MESFKENVNLSEGTLLLVVGLKGFEHQVISSQVIDEMGLSWANMVTNETTEIGVIMFPNVCSMRGGSQIRTG